MKKEVINEPSLKKAGLRNKSETTFDYVSKAYSPDVYKFYKGKTFFIRTYGCQANVRDEETMKGMLLNMGALEGTDIESDIVIINTCAVRENAEDKVYGELGILKNIYQTKKKVITCVCGCMVEQPEILDKILETFPYISVVFGTHEIKDFIDLIYESGTENTQIVAVNSKPGEVVEGLAVSRNSKYKAYVNIMYGCDKFCTYCIVPYTRGKERSRKYEDIILECQDLIDNGYQEIMLLGQNVNAYGNDLKEGYDFADLLEGVAKLGIPRLRFTTSHPWNFNDRMIDIIASYPNIMPFIHLPVQSGSDQILQRMGRRYTKAEYLELVAKMREKIPNLALSTDIIVGFPNESDDDFNETLDLVDKVKYDAAFTFIFSPRKGTPAAKMEDKITKEEKSARFQELVKHLEVSISASAQRMVGNTYKVLVDGISKHNPEYLSGYTESNKLVHFKGGLRNIGKIIDVKITESHTYSLIGEIVNE
ncbi:MAG: tRNA (N6-isopentenyl adenosine(37)-C2)-methylthiotransferase MiaB [Coprobacillus sp.]|nr:tRNA (N6-isopentenyl adenosine(37)-C2)-methylthiotransferase MiaB [Coprobacillus sp.]